MRGGRHTGLILAIALIATTAATPAVAIPAAGDTPNGGQWPTAYLDQFDQFLEYPAQAVLSPDGRYVAFTAPIELPDGTPNGNQEHRTFRWDVDTGNLVDVGIPGVESGTWRALLSDDGQYAVFSVPTQELAGSFVVPEGAPAWSVVRMDMTSGGLDLVNHRADSPTVVCTQATQAGGARDRAAESHQAMSALGDTIAFTSTCGDLVAGQDDRLSWEPYVWRDGEVRPVTAFGPTGEGGARLLVTDFSADGTVALLRGPGPDQTGFALWLFDTLTGTEPSLALEIPSGWLFHGAQLDQQANTVVFTTTYGFVIDDFNSDADVYRLDLATDELALITRGSDGRAVGVTGEVAVSRDGHVVAFASEADTVTTEVDDNAVADLFVWQHATGEVSLVTRHVDGTRSAERGFSGSLPQFALSGDGSTLAFTSQSTELVEPFDQGELDPDASPNAYRNAFVHDVATGTVDWITRRDDDEFERFESETVQQPQLSIAGNALLIQTSYDDLQAGRLHTPSGLVPLYVGLPDPTTDSCPNAGRGWTATRSALRTLTQECPASTTVHVNGHVRVAPGHFIPPSLAVLAVHEVGDASHTVEATFVDQVSGAFAMDVPRTFTWTDDEGVEHTGEWSDLRLHYFAFPLTTVALEPAYFIDVDHDLGADRTDVRLPLAASSVIGALNQSLTQLTRLSPDTLGDQTRQIWRHLYQQPPIIDAATAAALRRLELATGGTLEMVQVGGASFPRVFSNVATVVTTAVDLAWPSTGGGDRATHAQLRQAANRSLATPGGSNSPTAVSVLASRAQTTSQTAQRWLDSATWRGDGDKALLGTILFSVTAKLTNGLLWGLQRAGLHPQDAAALSVLWSDMLLGSVSAILADRWGLSLAKTLLNITLKLGITQFGQLVFDGRFRGEQVLTSGTYTGLFVDDLRWTTEQVFGETALDLEHGLALDVRTATDLRNELRDTYTGHLRNLSIVLDALIEAFSFVDTVGSVVGAAGTWLGRLTDRGAEVLRRAAFNLKVGKAVAALTNSIIALSEAYGAPRDARRVTCAAFGLVPASTGPFTATDAPCNADGRRTSVAGEPNSRTFLRTAADESAGTALRARLHELSDALDDHALALAAATTHEQRLNILLGEGPGSLGADLDATDLTAAASDSFVARGQGTVDEPAIGTYLEASVDWDLASMALRTLAGRYTAGLLLGAEEFGSDAEVALRQVVIDTLADAATSLQRLAAAAEPALDQATPSAAAPTIVVTLSPSLSADDGYPGARTVDDVQVVTADVANPTGVDLANVEITLVAGDGATVLEPATQRLEILPADTVGDPMRLSWEVRHDLTADVDAVLLQIAATHDGAELATNQPVSTVQLDWSLLDRDLDGMTDRFEDEHGLDPDDPDDATADPDGDGLDNLAEAGHATDPHVVDSDGDGIGDGDELTAGDAKRTDPADADTDGDGVGDASDPFPNRAGLDRLSGPSRLATAIAMSRTAFPVADSASAAVLARSDGFADGLAGTPLAAARGGPLLLTPPSHLDGEVRAELRRVLPDGATVYLLGGTAALRPDVEAALRDEGYDVIRLAGASRYDTAVAIADAIGDSPLILVARGDDFPDAIAAGAVAAARNGVILLSANDQPVEATTAALAARSGARVVTVGGAAGRAYPGHEAIVGASRTSTAALLADEFFPLADTAALARHDDFADALAGAALAASLGAPVLLTPTGALDEATADWLARHLLGRVLVFGGTRAVTDATAVAAGQYLDQLGLWGV